MFKNEFMPSSIDAVVVTDADSVAKCCDAGFVVAIDCAVFVAADELYKKETDIQLVEEYLPRNVKGRVIIEK